MKKLSILTMSIIAFALFASAEGQIIAEDYYISGRRTVGENVIEVTGILPNTLFVRLFVGESAEIRADVVPEDAENTKLLWSLPEGTGNVEISPGDRICRIRGIREGDETIRVDAPDGAHALVRVRVSDAGERALTLECDNTKISEGDSTTIEVRNLPDGISDIKWSITRGEKNVRINADGKECVVRGISGGDATITAESGEEKSEIRISVEGKETGIGIRVLVAILSVCAIALLIISAIFAIKRRRSS